MMVLVFLPVIGLVLYFFFGIDNKHRRLISDADLARLKSHTLSLAETLPPPEYDDRDADLVNLLRTTNKACPMPGNAVRVYTEFGTMLSDLLDDMRSARDHIHFEFFKIEDDSVGRAIEEVFVEKIREGVEVRVQYDDAANLDRKRFFRRLRDEGVQVQPFLKVVIPFISSDTNYRNHRKLVVIDGRIGYTGGMNIAERYLKGIRGGVLHRRLAVLFAADTRRVQVLSGALAEGLCHPAGRDRRPHGRVAGDHAGHSADDSLEP